MATYGYDRSIPGRPSLTFIYIIDVMDGYRSMVYSRRLSMIINYSMLVAILYRISPWVSVFAFELDILFLSICYRCPDPQECVEGRSWNIYGLPYDGRSSRESKYLCVFMPCTNLTSQSSGLKISPMQADRYTAFISRRRVCSVFAFSFVVVNSHSHIPADPLALIDLIHQHKMKAGIAISPDTPSTAITDEVAAAVDMLLVMTVYPGRGGQKFIDRCVPKVAELRARFPEKDIEVDGGVGPSTIHVCADAGT